MKKITIISALVLAQTITYGQCANPANIFGFNHNGHRYEIIKENRSWMDANNCATERGGYLLMINNSAEQAAVNTALNNAGINSNNTKAPDGGNASYVWTSGNDRQTEGKWVWGNTSDAFWSGNVSGSNVSGAYTNWGSVQNREPDNFINEQHALGLAITNWPNGLKGEWNDIKESNTLYFIVEFNQTVGLSEINDNHNFTLFPNPTKGIINIQYPDNGTNIKEAVICEMSGRILLVLSNLNGIKDINISNFVRGSYIVNLISDDDKRVVRKIELF